MCQKFARLHYLLLPQVINCSMCTCKLTPIAEYLSAANCILSIFNYYRYYFFVCVKFMPEECQTVVLLVLYITSKWCLN
jgi:hypothetical protein